MDKPSADFSSRTLEDFINDPGFVLWVTGADQTADQFWLQIQEQHPQLIPVIKEARLFISSLRFKSDYMNSQEKELLWQKIKGEMAPVKRTVRRFSFWMRSAAAVFLLGMLGAGLFFYFENQKHEERTAFGQRKTLTLPDGSVVILNANSSLHYAKKWDTEEPREVWIEGEAFFKVKHLHQSGLIKKGERFIVHARKLNVEVLGTSFNVKNRKGLIKVALVTGKVGIDVAGTRNSEIRLLPGELAEYRDRTHQMIKKTIHVGDYTAWSTGELHLNNTPLKEVLGMIEETYGYTVVLKDSVLATRKLSGSFSSSSEDALFKALSASLGIKIEKNSSTHQLIIK
jgi:transmembrane sensor